MLIRIVRLTFEPAWVDDFVAVFERTSPEIRATAGCHHLELWRDADFPHVFTTYSHWENEDALDRYRSSELFRSTWGQVKPHFTAPPEAHSYARWTDSPAERTG